MENKPLDKMTDLELCKIQQLVYGQLMQAQANIQAINAEIQKRETKVPIVDKVEKK